MLAELRQKIDAIDDAIIALLAERTQIVEEVGKLKSAHSINSSFIRPGREATMLRRLMERISQPFPKMAVAALWRIIIGASLNIEQKLQVSVHVHDGDVTPYWYSREYFGAFTSLITHHTSAQVMSDLAQDKANVGVLFLPQGTETDSWWCNINPERHKLHVFAHIPFVQHHSEWHLSDSPRLVALAKVEPEETGDDRTLVVLKVSATLSQAKIMQHLATDALEAVCLASANPHDIASSRKYYLLEVKGFLLKKQVLLEAWIRSIDKTASVTLLGSYATPVVV